MKPYTKQQISDALCPEYRWVMLGINRQTITAAKMRRISKEMSKRKPYGLAWQRYHKQYQALGKELSTKINKIMMHLENADKRFVRNNKSWKAKAI